MHDFTRLLRPMAGAGGLDDVRHSANFGLRRTPGCTGAARVRRRDHSPLSLTVMDCHSLGMHTVILLSLIP